jgi:transposase-like protein
VLSELKGRGVADVCIVCCDGLTGLPDAIGVSGRRQPSSCAWFT